MNNSQSITSADEAKQAIDVAWREFGKRYVALKRIASLSLKDAKYSATDQFVRGSVPIRFAVEVEGAEIASRLRFLEPLFKRAHVQLAIFEESFVPPESLEEYYLELTKALTSFRESLEELRQLEHAVDPLLGFVDSPAARIREIDHIFAGSMNSAVIDMLLMKVGEHYDAVDRYIGRTSRQFINRSTL